MGRSLCRRPWSPGRRSATRNFDQSHTGKLYQTGAGSFVRSVSRGVGDEMAGWAISWSGVFEPIGPLIGQTWTEEPLIVVGLLIPCVLALASRDLTAVAVSALLAVLGFLAVHVSVADSYQAGVVLVTGLAGILVGIQAARFRRTRRSLYDAQTDLTRVREELADVRSKYDREVHWRRAAEKVPSERSLATTSASP
jgi:hypothetical protein